MLDVFVVRKSGSSGHLRVMASQSDMAVVNALTDDEHPTQAIADLSVLSTVLGSLNGLRVLYLGEGNNTAAALTLAFARIPGAQIDLRTPAGYGLPERVLSAARTAGRLTGSVIEMEHEATNLPDVVDVVYTTRWESMGVPKVQPGWRALFSPFRVTNAMMRRYPDAVFMHDLPAHRGLEVEASVIDGPQSIVFEQAEHKLFSAMAVMEWCVDPRMWNCWTKMQPWRYC